MTHPCTETESLPPIFSPQRFFLDAPKQQPGTCFVLNSDFEKAMAEIKRLNALINTPHTAEFLEAVKLEAVHQRQRWAAEHIGTPHPACPTCAEVARLTVKTEVAPPS